MKRERRLARKRNNDYRDGYIDNCHTVLSSEATVNGRGRLTQDPVAMAYAYLFKYIIIGDTGKYSLVAKIANDS